MKTRILLRCVHCFKNLSLYYSFSFLNCLLLLYYIILHLMTKEKQPFLFSSVLIFYAAISKNELKQLRKLTWNIRNFPHANFWTAESALWSALTVPLVLKRNCWTTQKNKLDLLLPPSQQVLQFGLFPGSLISVLYMSLLEVWYFFLHLIFMRYSSQTQAQWYQSGLQELKSLPCILGLEEMCMSIKRSVARQC